MPVPDTIQDLHKIKNFYSKYKVLSCGEDDLMVFGIFKYMKPKSVWELGAGSGNWCMLMDYMMRPYCTTFHMVENFDTTLDFNRPDYVSPVNSADLIMHVEKVQRELGHSPINAVYHFDNVENIYNQLDTAIDIARLDCTPLDPTAAIEWLIAQGSDNLVIVVDDTTITKCLDRVTAMQEQVAAGHLKPLWIGLDSAAWVRSTVDTTPLLNTLINRYGHLFGRCEMVYAKFFGKDYWYLVTEEKPYKKVFY